MDILYNQVLKGNICKFNSIKIGGYILSDWIRDLITENNKKQIHLYYNIKRTDDSNDKKLFEILNKFVDPSVRNFAERRYIQEAKKRLSYMFAQKSHE